MSKLKIRILPQGENPGDHVIDHWRYIPIINSGKNAGQDIEFFAEGESCDILIAPLQLRYYQYFAQKSSRIICDLTDDPFSYPWHRLNPAGKLYVFWKRLSTHYQKKIKTMLNNSDGAFVGSDEQQKIIENLTKNPKVLTDSIPFFNKNQKPDEPLHVTEKTTIAWFGNLESLDGLYALTPALNSLDPNNYRVLIITSPQTRGRFLGTPPKNADDIRKKLNLESIQRSWSKDDFHKHLAQADIGIVPVDMRSRFTHSKPAGRALLMMALGIPTVVSATPSHKAIIRNGRNGYIATNNQEWSDTLNMLAQNETLACSVSETSRRYVRQHFSATQFGQEALKYITHLEDTHEHP